MEWNVQLVSSKSVKEKCSLIIMFGWFFLKSVKEKCNLVSISSQVLTNVFDRIENRNIKIITSFFSLVQTSR